MERLKFETPDMVAENVEKIGALFPNCITEALDEGKSTLEKKVYKQAINFELLKQMLSPEALAGDEAYEFTWVGKKAAIVEANAPIRATLRPCPEESVNWDTTENLYIEGDNLQVLKLLQESYLGKVKMIYIDPPYNRGEDLIFRDNFIMKNAAYEEQIGLFDESGERLFKNTDSNGRFHSDWCSMIYPRLVMARNLLSDPGCIFISIDDHEVDSLRLICNEVFGESNFIACFVWNTEGHTDNQYDVKVNHEYILLYAKHSVSFEAGYVVDPNTRSESNLWKGFAENSITKNGPANPPSEITLPRGFPCKLKEGIITNNKPKDAFFEEVATTKYISRQLTEKYDVDYPIRYHDIFISDGVLQNDCTVYSGWANANKLKRFISNGCVPLTEKNGDQFSFYLSERGVIYYYKLRSSARNIVSVLRNLGTTESMRSQLEKEGLFFSYPKPVDLLKHLVKIGVYSDGTVLDFFSGSASMAHAVMQLNAEDGGQRNFIMVQLPEKCNKSGEAYKAGYRTICDIGKKRIRLVGDKIKESDGSTATNVDIGFRVLKLDSSNMKDIYYSPAEVSQAGLFDMVSNIKEDRNDLDLLFGCLIDWGLPLSLPYTSEQIEGCTVHTYNDGDLIACFNENIPDSVIREIARRKPLRAVFRDASFADSPAKINAFELFKLLAPDASVKVI